MRTAYKKAKTHIQSLQEFDPQLPWLLTLDLLVIVAALGFGLGGAL